MHTKTRLATLTAVVVAAALTLVGCSAGSSSSSTEKVNLTYWDWTPGMDAVVSEWNTAHPNIHVTFDKIVGSTAYPKFLAAIKAGSGAPDIMQVEFQAVPQMVASKAVTDISPYLSSSLSTQFTKGQWNQVTLGTKGVYGVPQNSGVMMFYYRKDVFAKYGLTVPTTWDEYATVAAKLHAADPNEYLGTFSAGDGGWFAGLTQQAGASWYSTAGGKWSADIDSAASQKVASYWGDLVQKGVIDNQPFFTPAWNARMSDGTLAGWVGAAWAGAILTGSAPTAANQWAVAPLPQWGSTPADGTWGGASFGVSTQSKHPKEAAEFVQWVNASKDGLASLIKATGGLYPSDTKNGPGLLTTSPAYFSEQPDFWEQIEKQAPTVNNFTYGPNITVAYSAYNQYFGEAAQAKTQSAFVSALASVQKATADDLTSSGYGK